MRKRTNYVGTWWYKTYFSQTAHYVSLDGKSLCGMTGFTLELSFRLSLTAHKCEQCERALEAQRSKEDA